MRQCFFHPLPGEKASQFRNIGAHYTVQKFASESEIAACQRPTAPNRPRASASGAIAQNASKLFLGMN